ncbi:uncharacterized protein K452DRAFT_6871 [Aplosporella prunicola CBS 121167]|uniref:Uncharacterized protein n=1 Tax=Aplosporella prunicola CBS 121167 TaxID=1176127 RepID=A0A6A6BTI5_9PEZI|nr:uncharacterized protein K452DRAFT_6871 [Aplosporella prunicola CBS 121167]KAF2147396.1 hypothetical protein K452DRAFT_6871 [Aplosporella prunicola CBS 121167]
MHGAATSSRTQIAARISNHNGSFEIHVDGARHWLHLLAALARADLGNTQPSPVLAWPYLRYYRLIPSIRYAFWSLGMRPSTPCKRALFQFPHRRLAHPPRAISFSRCGKTYDHTRIPPPPLLSHGPIPSRQRAGLANPSVLLRALGTAQHCAAPHRNHGNAHPPHPGFLPPPRLGTSSRTSFPASLLSDRAVPLSH